MGKFKEYINEMKGQLDPVHTKVRELAKGHFGRIYSQGLIGKNKDVRRLSIPVGGHLSKTYDRYGRGYGKGTKDFTPGDKQKMEHLKTSFHDKLRKHGIDPKHVDVAYHVGSGTYASVRTKLHSPKSHLKLDTKGNIQIKK